MTFSYDQIKNKDNNKNKRLLPKIQILSIEEQLKGGSKEKDKI